MRCFQPDRLPIWVNLLAVAAVLSTLACAGGPDLDIARPGVNENPPTEVMPEMTYYEVPHYPRLAEQAGLQGTVWIRSLVGTDGEVKEANIYKSSGTPALDQAALEAAPRCTFKPAMQNGRPVAMWVTYKVEFILE